MEPHRCTRCGKVTPKAVCEDCVGKSDDDWGEGDTGLMGMGTFAPPKGW